MRYNILYGKQSLSLDIPPQRLVGVLAPRAVTAVPDVGAAVRRSLTQPVESRPLAELVAGKRSALIVTVDNTRPSPEPMITPILDLCEGAGLSVTVMIAIGRHRQMTHDEIVAHLGARLMARCRVLQHDAFASEMVERGVTQRGTPIRVNAELLRHDVVIGCGIIEPSYLCGWSGGRKLLMPGLAHHASIDNNHYYLTHPDAQIGRLHGNPVSDDALEFARALPLHFIVYAISGPKDEVVEIVSGHPVVAHERACALCAPIYTVERTEADIVISSPGGWPYDLDLVQGKKAILPAGEVVKRNGVIILCAECPEGHGAEGTFIQWLTSKTPAEVVRDVRDRQQFTLGAHGANILAKPIVERGAKVLLVTSPRLVGELSGSYVTAMARLEDAWEMANRLAGREASVLCIENARRLMLR